jgi:outer membrane murein-binding lipoprotein Lpp
MVTRRIFAAIVLGGLLSGCATGAKYGDASTFPTLSPSQGRT